VHAVPPSGERRVQSVCVPLHAAGSPRHGPLPVEHDDLG
jgi:hypothetical protein